MKPNWVNPIIIIIKEEGRRGFPQGKEEQLCKSEENPIISDSFTQIYILFSIGFRVGPPKMHRRFHIGHP